MALYQQGSSTNTSGLKTVGTRNLLPNKEYIFEYGSPAFAYRLLSPDHVATLIKGWLALNSEPVDISGISIDTDTGKVRIRATVKPSPQIEEAGLNPYVVFAIIAGLFAAIGIGITLLYVYELTSGGASGSWNPAAPSADPCSTPGIVNYITCLARKTGWVAFGIALGVLATLVLILVTVGRKA